MLKGELEQKTRKRQRGDNDGTICKKEPIGTVTNRIEWGAKGGYSARSIHEVGSQRREGE